MAWLRSLAWWRCPPRGEHDLDLEDLDLQIAVAKLVRRLSELPVRFDRLETLIMTSAQDVITRIDAATTEVANDFTDLRTRLASAVADKDQAVQDAVTALLAEFDAPIARLESLGADPTDPVPAEPAPVDVEVADPAAEAPTS